MNVYEPTASCLTQIRQTLSAGAGQWGLDSSDVKKGSGESYSDKTKEKELKSAKEKIKRNVMKGRAVALPGSFL